MNTFSASAMVKYGWETFKKRPLFLIGITILLMVVSGVLQKVTGEIAIIGSILSIAVGAIIDKGSNTFALRANDSIESAHYNDLWQPQEYLKYLGAVILTGIIIVVGFILLIVPGVIAVLTLMFVKQLVIDKHLAPVEAIKESARITKGHRVELFWLLIILVVMNIIGAICLFVGLLVTIPITMIAIAHAYRTIAGSAIVAVAPVTPATL